MFPYRDATNPAVPRRLVRNCYRIYLRRGDDVGASGIRWMPWSGLIGMKRIVPVLFFLIVAAAAAQPAPPPRAPEPAPMTVTSGNGDAEQRAQLWRSLTPEQKARSLARTRPHERREMRERLAPNAPDGEGRPWMLRRHFEGGDGSRA